MASSYTRQCGSCIYCDLRDYDWVSGYNCTCPGRVSRTQLDDECCSKYEKDDSKTPEVIEEETRR